MADPLSVGDPSGQPGNKRRRGGMIVGIAVALVAVAGVGAWWWQRSTAATTSASASATVVTAAALTPSPPAPAPAATPSASGYLLISPDSGLPPVGTITNSVVFSDVGIASVLVEVSGDAVTANVCFTQSDLSDVRSCVMKPGDEPGWWPFTGTRDGDTARVRATGADADAFTWGTVAFASGDPAAAPVAFTAAPDCQRFDGGYGLRIDDPMPRCEGGPLDAPSLIDPMALCQANTGTGNVATGTYVFDHSAWGTTALITCGTDDASVPTIRAGALAVDASAQVSWSLITTDAPYYLFALASPATDASGNIFIQYDPGRYDGIAVLRPTATGIDVLAGPYDEPMPNSARFYDAELVGPGADGLYRIEQYANDCDPSCADGTTTSQTFVWNGTDYEVG